MFTEQQIKEGAARAWVQQHIGRGAAITARLYNETPNVADGNAAGEWIQVASQVLQMLAAAPQPAGEPVGYLSKNGHYMPAAAWDRAAELTGYNIPLYAAPQPDAARIAALQAEAERLRALLASTEAAREALQAEVWRQKGSAERARTDEREACARACEEQRERWTDDRARYASAECAAAIRDQKEPT